MIKRAASWVWRLLDDALFNFGMALLFLGLALIHSGAQASFEACVFGWLVSEAAWRTKK